MHQPPVGLASRICCAMAAFVLLTSTPRLCDAQTAAEARAGVDSLGRRFSEVFKGNKGAQAAADLYTEDAIFVGGDGRVAKGRAALVAELKGAFAAVTVKEWTTETTFFRNEGPLAYAGGTERARIVDKKTGKEMTEMYQTLVVFKQGPDKRWRLAYGMETKMPPKTKAP